MQLTALPITHTCMDLLNIKEPLWIWIENLQRTQVKHFKYAQYILCMFVCKMVTQNLNYESKYRWTLYRSEQLEAYCKF